MVDPWAEFRVKPEEAKSDEWAGLRASEPYRGRILPFSKGEDGKVRFDSNAGVIGDIKRAFTLPGEVYSGQIDPKSDEGIGRAFDFATVFGPGVPGGAGPYQKPIPGGPSADQLKAAGSAGYKAMREANVDFDPRAVKSFADTAGAELEALGFRRGAAENTFDVLFGKDGLANPPPNAIAPLAGLESARQTLSNYTVDRGIKDTDRKAAVELLKRLDAFLEQPPGGAVVAGNAEQAAQILKDARGNWAAAKRSELLARKEDITSLRAAAANSGQNFDQALRGRVASIPFDKREIAGFTPGEEDALRAFVEGSKPRNAAREVANVLGGGGGMGMAVPAGMGAMIGGFLGGGPGAAIGTAVPPVVGRVAKMLQNKMSEAEFGKLQEMVRSRSPLARAMAENPRKMSHDARMESALMRALMGLPLDDQQSR